MEKDPIGPLKYWRNIYRECFNFLRSNPPFVAQYKTLIHGLFLSSTYPAALGPSARGALCGGPICLLCSAIEGLINVHKVCGHFGRKAGAR